MQVAVTGATGFIGRHVVAELLGQGHTVVASATSAEKLPSLPWCDDVRFVMMDLHADIDESFDRLGRPDVLIHLAWKGLPNYQHLFHLEENLWHQYRFLRSMVKSGLRQLVVAGTCLEYGLQNGCLSENTPTAPTTPYALAKDSLRRMLEQLCKVQPFVMQWMRVFYVYGAGQPSNSLLPQLVHAVEAGETEFPMSGGEQLRDYLPVEEVARRFVRTAEQTTVTGVINCCSGVPTSVRRLVENYLCNCGATIELKLGAFPYPNYEPMAFWGATQRWSKVEEQHEND